jgi:hypothetical protein
MYLRSRSGDQMMLQRSIASKLGLFSALSYIEGSVLDVDVDSESLQLLLQFYHDIDDDQEIPKPLPFCASFVITFSRALGDTLYRQALWIDRIAIQNRLGVWKLFEAANYFHAQKLLDLCSARLAFEFKSMNENELRDVLKLSNDL